VGLVVPAIVMKVMERQEKTHVPDIDWLNDQLNNASLPGGGTLKHHLNEVIAGGFSGIGEAPGACISKAAGVEPAGCVDAQNKLDRVLAKKMCGQQTAKAAGCKWIEGSISGVSTGCCDLSEEGVNATGNPKCIASAKKAGFPNFHKCIGPPGPLYTMSGDVPIHAGGMEIDLASYNVSADFIGNLHNVRLERMHLASDASSGAVAMRRAEIDLSCSLYARSRFF
jgi:hypothetical protein